MITQKLKLTPNHLYGLVWTFQWTTCLLYFLIYFCMIKVVGAGAKNPIASNRYPMGTSFNRRVEVVVE